MLRNRGRKWLQKTLRVTNAALLLVLIPNKKGEPSRRKISSGCCLCIFTDSGNGGDEDAQGRQRETRGRENGGHGGKAWAGEREGGRREGREPRPTAACFLDSLSTISRARAAPGIGLRSTGDVCSPASKYPAASRPTLTRSLSDLSKSVPHSATRVVYVRAATACGGAAGRRADGRTIAASILKLPPKLPRVRRVYIQRVRPGIDFDSKTETPFLGSCPK